MTYCTVLQGTVTIWKRFWDSLILSKFILQSWHIIGRSISTVLSHTVFTRDQVLTVCKPMSRTVIIGKFALGTYRYKPYYFICSGTHCVGSGLFWTGSGSDQTINDEPCTIWLQIQIRIQTRIRRIKINFLSNIHQKTKTNKYFLYSVGGFYNIVNMVADRVVADEIIFFVGTIRG